MKKNKKGFSLVIAILLVAVSSLLAYTIIGFILPFSKNIKDIENATRSYYRANSGLEEGLFFINSRKDKNITEEIKKIETGYSYESESEGTELPIPGEGNASNEKTDYNNIALGEPIQLSIGYSSMSGREFGELKLQFDEDRGLSDGIINKEDYKLDDNVGYIAWQLTNGKTTISSNADSLITGDKITGGRSIKMSQLKPGVMYDNDGNEVTSVRITKFFESPSNRPIPGYSVMGGGCTENTQKCILTFSVIRDFVLKTASGEEILISGMPWKIVSKEKIPLRYTLLSATGKELGFQKTLEIRIPQETINQAFNIAVLN